jgi:multidrug efflux pump subunit AcrA (membrane-fusion protein)
MKPITLPPPFIRSLALLAFASVLVIAPGCKKPDARGHMPPPPQVTVAPVEQQELVEWEELTGRTAAIDYVEVRPRVSGHIEKVRFESGQLVKKGDVLFTIDPRWQKAAYEQREAELAMAQVRLDNAERDAKRNAQLLAGKAISKEEADGREAKFAEARAIPPSSTSNTPGFARRLMAASAARSLLREITSAALPGPPRCSRPSFRWIRSMSMRTWMKMPCFDTTG